MSEPTRVRPYLLVTLALCIAHTLGAQSPSRTTKDSIGRAVQEFYNWYLPRSANPGQLDVIMLAATRGPIPFDTVLVHWLRVDSTAQARAKDEIDGLDSDPYLNAQDPCEAYTVKGVRTQGTKLLVDVLGHGGCFAHQRADVTVVLGVRAGRWAILEFLYPNHNERLIPLLKMLHPNSR